MARGSSEQDILERLHDPQHGPVPLRMARSILPTLRWPSLMALSVDPRVPPATRREAARILEQRLEQLALGEQVTLARGAPRALFPALLQSAHVRVLGALLGNPRLIEMDAVRLGTRPDAPPGALALLAEHRTWGGTRAVMLALAAHPRTPIPVALRVLGRLSTRDLRRLSQDVRVPRIVALRAERLVQGQSIAREDVTDGSGRGG